MPISIATLFRRSLLAPLLALAAFETLSGCDAASASAPADETSSIHLHVQQTGAAPAVALRAAAPQRGGRIVLHLWNSLLAVSRTDSFAWDGSAAIEHLFTGLPAGAGYRIAALYRSPQGLATHRDTSSTIALGRGETSQISLVLRAVLARVQLSLPTVPSQVDTVSLSFSTSDLARHVRTARGTGGRTLLGLDSLPVGMPGNLRLRAWNRTLDTLFQLDTVVAFSGNEDQTLALVLQSALAASSLTLSFAPGGQADAVGGFAGESDQPGAQTGRLVISAVGDSGASDWIRIANPGETAFLGSVRLGKGSGDAQFALDLAPGASIVVTRASAAQVAAPSHPFHGSAVIVDQPLIVVTHSGGGALWKLRNADGSELHDAVFIQPGEGFWPEANSGLLRTLRLRSGSLGAIANDFGSNWCSDGSDAPDGNCP